jgi:hypothetical protein
VCGQLQEEPPWRDGFGSLEICTSCGDQFGYTDMAGGSAAKREALWQAWRQEWISNSRKPLTQTQIHRLLDRLSGRATE